MNYITDRTTVYTKNKKLINKFYCTKNRFLLVSYNKLYNKTIIAFLYWSIHGFFYQPTSDFDKNMY